LLAGHVDSWHYGAMDNAGANAVMMEAGRLLARTRLYRGLRLTFWSGHSHGRYAGSAWYVDSHWDELNARCAAHLNVDSVGGRGAHPVRIAGPPARLRRHRRGDCDLAARAGKAAGRPVRHLRVCRGSRASA